MRHIARFATEYPVTILMLVLGVMLLGYISFSKLGMDLFPDLKSPRIFVELTAGERPPEEIEKQFVKSIESLSIQQKNTVQVSSVIRSGSALITVEYSWEADMDEALLDLQKSLSSFTQNAEIDEITISQHDPNAAPIILLGLSHPEISDMDELRRVAENYLQNELIRMEGIADVKLIGEEVKEVAVETNDYLMEAYNVTPANVASKIQDYNRNISGGSLVEMGTKYIVKGVGELTSIENIEQIVVTYKTVTTSDTQTSALISERAPVYLKDIATVSLRNKRPENIMRVNGKRCVGLALYKETKFNTVTVVNNFIRTFDSLKKALPGYELTVIQNKGEFITASISEVKQALLIGIFFAIAVLYVFLRKIGTTAIVSMAIPISIVATFNLMYFKGLSLNIMTLGGLALGAGMLVDNAIVVMENIFRNLESGLSLKEACITGTAQVGGAITASTVTTIVVFLPIVYLHGTSGELFKEQAWTVAFSLLCSLAVAMLVIPMLSSKFLGRYTSPERLGRSLRFPRYRKFLSWLLKGRFTVIGAAVAFIALGFILMSRVGGEFMPQTKLNDYVIDVKLPEGTELYRTEEVVKGLEQRIRDILGDDITSMYSIAGTSENISANEQAVLLDENTASIHFTLRDNHAIGMDALFTGVNAVLDATPDLEARFSHDQTALELSLGTEAAPIVIELRGEDLDRLQDLTEQAKNQVASIGDLYNLETSFDEGRPEIEIVVDRVRAGLQNIGISQISSQLQAALTGTQAGQWDESGEIRDITIELPKITPGQLGDLVVIQGERRIPLYDVADVRNTLAPKEILRKNQTRIGEVTASIRAGVPLDQVVRAISEKMDTIPFPVDYSYEIKGQEQMRKEAFQNLKFALILSLILVYMVLASQFESLVHPFTVILSIPLAGVGAVMIFYLLGLSFNIMAYIGVIMLAGIAVNNAIILVDCINQLKREGLSPGEAILEAGQRRIRPIIMTSLTTILALLPLAAGIGEGAELRAPMALAVIGGLVTSTALTLVVIPCVYSVLEGLLDKREA